MPPRTSAPSVLPLLAVLALLPPGKAIAGPPEGVAGKMVFDEVADGLRRYRWEKDPARRSAWRQKLARSLDPRAAMALHEASIDPAESVGVQVEAIGLLDQYFVRGTRFQNGNSYHLGDWWKANEADLRRRAKQLPQ